MRILPYASVIYHLWRRHTIYHTPPSRRRHRPSMHSPLVSRLQSQIIPFKNASKGKGRLLLRLLLGSIALAPFTRHRYASQHTPTSATCGLDESVHLSHIVISISKLTLNHVGAGWLIPLTVKCLCFHSEEILLLVQFNGVANTMTSDCYDFGQFI